MLKILTKSKKQTFNLGKKLAKELKGGKVIALSGELGTGKTVFTKGLANGLGIKKHITSPSFVLMKVYTVSPPPEGGLGGGKEGEIEYFVHIDAYRVKNAQELIDIGILDYFNRPDCVCAIEWADKIKKILPKKRIDILFKHGKMENERIIRISSNFQKPGFLLSQE
ncbi:tRNA (adenosine(37)-N6)-threonylcarbamoyltransferase complex ATPase subunit type 1 TsaE [bacterium]|nr:tRNA (adenosine(37)-N6)-threonylcarbamoyltransferase complex ATPase subunit type 1 TsaE [bacterium]